MKKFISTILIIILVTLSIPIQVNAANVADLQKAKITWDIKSNKEFKFQTYCAGVGYKSIKTRVKNLKITDADKKGYNKLTFSIEMDAHDFIGQFSDDEFQKMYDYCNRKKLDTDCRYYYTLVDYQTGKCLEQKNDKNVTCKLKYFDYVYTEDMELKKIIVEKVTVIYPKNYKNLCLLVGGMTKKGLDHPKTDSKYDNGKKAFSKTSMYDKKNKKVSHGIRIR